MSNLDWRLILATSLSGFAFAVTTIFAWISGFEQWVAAFLLAVIVTSMVLLAPQFPARNAFAAGFLTALFAVWTQAAFLPLYFANNPSYQAVDIPFGLTALAWTVLSAPLGAIFAGLIAAFLAWLIGKMVRSLQS